MTKKTREEALAADAATRLSLPEIRLVSVDDLEPRDKNPNAMSAEDFRLLTEAIRRAGFLQPLLVRPHETIAGRFEIVDGVHRWTAAKEVGHRELPCVVVHSDEQEAAALQVGMNRLRGELDLAKVAEVLGELDAAGWSREAMTLSGFSEEEVAALLKSVEIEDEEDVLAGPAATPRDEEEEETTKAFVLEVPMPDVKTLRSARRKLKKLGGGDLGRGLVALLEEV